MPTLKELNMYGEDLERLIRLRTSPIAVKMLEKEDDIPDGAIRPKRDHGIHLAQCQAFAMSRRDGATVAMLKEDNWCFAPLIAYGLVEEPDDPSIKRFTSFPRLDRGKYIGIVSAPLRTANFEPDLVLIYSNTAQLRDILMPSHSIGQEALVNSHFFPPSCAYIVVPVLSNGQYMVALPDPGDYTRAMAGDDEIILSVPRDKMEELISELRQYEEMKQEYTYSTRMMMADFPQPELYKKLFRKWGLYAED
jgi:uncharacterized protein (DUF169 family)